MSAQAKRLCLENTWTQLESAACGGMCRLTDAGAHDFLVKLCREDTRYVAGIAIPYLTPTSVALQWLDAVLAGFWADVAHRVPPAPREDQLSAQCRVMFERVFADANSPSGLERARDQVRAVGTMMQGAIAAALVRSCNVDALGEKSQALYASSALFDTRARAVEQSAWRREWRARCLLGAVLCLIAAGAVSVIVLVLA